MIAFVECSLAVGDGRVEEVFALVLQCRQRIHGGGVLRHGILVLLLQKQLVAGVGEVGGLGQVGSSPSADVEFLLQRQLSIHELVELVLRLPLRALQLQSAEGGHGGFGCGGIWRASVGGRHWAYCRRLLDALWQDKEDQGADAAEQPQGDGEPDTPRRQPVRRAVGAASLCSFPMRQWRGDRLDDNRIVRCWHRALPRPAPPCRHRRRRLPALPLDQLADRLAIRRERLGPAPRNRGA